MSGATPACRGAVPLLLGGKAPLRNDADPLPGYESGTGSWRGVTEAVAMGGGGA
jgi:hypothetical protein